MAKILVAGDYCPNHRISEMIKYKKYSDIFSSFKKYIESADFSIVNLECPVYEGPNTKGNDKVGPTLKTSEYALEALKYAGFDMVCLANNHIMDYCAEGLNQTIKACKKYNIDYVGAGLNLAEARKTNFIDLKGKRVAIINIAENEFSVARENRPGANPLDHVENYYAIQSALKNSDHVILIYHGGHEGFFYPSPRIKKLFRYYIDLGVSAVFCHHSHRVSGYEKYGGGLIFYGLGNFIFDWHKKTNEWWKIGYFVELDLCDMDFLIRPYIQGYDKPGLQCLDEEYESIFWGLIEKINTIIADDVKLNEEFLKFSSINSKSYNYLIQPYPGYYLGGAYRRGLLPSLISKEKIRRTLNMIRCESHLDVFLSVLDSELKD